MPSGEPPGAGAGGPDGAQRRPWWTDPRMRTSGSVTQSWFLDRGWVPMEVTTDPVGLMETSNPSYRADLPIGGLGGILTGKGEGDGASPRESESPPAVVEASAPAVVEASAQPAHDQQQENGAHEGHDDQRDDAGAEVDVEQPEEPAPQEGADNAHDHVEQQAAAHAHDPAGQQARDQPHHQEDQEVVGGQAPEVDRVARDVDPWQCDAHGSRSSTPK